MGIYAGIILGGFAGYAADSPMIGWRRAFDICGIVGVVYAVPLFALLRNPPRPKDLEPTYTGHSTGHWQGETLVVDTVGFNEGSWIEAEGFPHTDKLHMIERFTRTDFNLLKYEVTVDDPLGVCVLNGAADLHEQLEPVARV